MISKFTNGFSTSKQETFTVNNKRLGSEILVLILSAENKTELSGSLTDMFSAFIPAPSSGVVTILTFSKFTLSFACSLASFWISGVYWFKSITFGSTKRNPA